MNFKVGFVLCYLIGIFYTKGRKGADFNYYHQFKKSYKVLAYFENIYMENTTYITYFL